MQPLLANLLRPSIEEDPMNCPLVKWISVFLLLICLTASVPFNRRTTAESIKDDESASQRDWRGRADVDCPILSRYATDLTLLALRGKLQPADDHDADIARV